MRLRLGTRGSELARTQSGLVADALRALGHEVELITVRTDGDTAHGSLMAEGGLGLFAAALREALLAGVVDLAVHSFKDLPTAEVPGLTIAAVPERELPFDALCSAGGLTLDVLPAGARVGTGSPRRAAQLKRRRPDLTLVEIRGNVPTRLARVHGDATGPGDLDAVVLARAGLARLGRFDAMTEVLDLVPAPAQGALAVECRSDDADTLAALAALDHAESRLAALTERAVLAQLGGGCAAPIGVHAHVVNGHLEVRGIVVSADGTAAATARHSEPLPVDPLAAAARVAGKLLADGAAEVTPLGASRPSQLGDFHDEASLWAPGTVDDLVGRHILLPRSDGPLAQVLRAAGADVDCVPLTRTTPLPLDGLPAGADWVVFTSPVGVQTLADARVPVGTLGRRIAAVGRATADAVARAGQRVDFVPCLPGRAGAADAATLVEAFPDGPGTVLLPGSALAKPDLAEGLRAKGWEVAVFSTYTTSSVEDADPDTRQRWASGHYDVVVVTAGSTARAVLDVLGPPPPHTRVVAFGRPSAAAASEAGLAVASLSPTQDGVGLLAAVVEALGQARPQPNPSEGSSSWS